MPAFVQHAVRFYYGTECKCHSWFSPSLQGQKHMFLASRTRPWSNTCLLDKGLEGISKRKTFAGDSGAKRHAKVAELLILLQVKEDVTVENAESLMDSLWSLQYMTGRGILCAFAGQTEMIWNTYRGSKSLQSSHSSIQPTHIVHIRFTDSQAAQKFENHAEFLKVVEQKVAPLCAKHRVLSFEADCEWEMESMFRRGPEWESGLEHILIIKANNERTAECETYCSQLGEIATSRLCNALQSQIGFSREEGDVSKMSDNIVIMSRFAEADEASRFVSLPPVSRILDGDSDLPANLILQTAFSIAGAQKSKSATPSQSRLH